MQLLEGHLIFDFLMVRMPDGMEVELPHLPIELIVHLLFEHPHHRAALQMLQSLLPSGRKQDPIILLHQLSLEPLFSPFQSWGQV
jgi:hypothetical protein